MLKWLFGAKPAAWDSPPAVPAGRRIYAIGDIHGRLDLLRKLHRLVERDAADRPDLARTLVYLGDYVDRGRHSRETIDYLLDEPLASFELVYLRGNHEAVMVRALTDSTMVRRWLRFGGDMTLFSYGITLTASEATPETIADAQIALRAALPRRHYRFLRRLRPDLTVGDYHFVHAGIRPGVPLEAQDPEDLMWIRDKFLKSKKHHGKVVVHGHSPVEAVEFRDNRIAIDTGAHASGRLTALVLEGTTRRLLATVPAGAVATAGDRGA